MWLGVVRSSKDDVNNCQGVIRSGKNCKIFAASGRSKDAVKNFKDVATI
jgi:hypothetical protein